MDELKIGLTEAGILSRLNGYINASDFLIELSKKVGRVIVIYKTNDKETVFNVMGDICQRKGKGWYG